MRENFGWAAGPQLFGFGFAGEPRRAFSLSRPSVAMPAYFALGDWSAEFSGTDTDALPTRPTNQAGGRVGVWALPTGDLGGLTGTLDNLSVRQRRASPLNLGEKRAKWAKWARIMAKGTCDDVSRIQCWGSEEDRRFLSGEPPCVAVERRGGDDKKTATGEEKKKMLVSQLQGLLCVCVSFIGSGTGNARSNSGNGLHQSCPSHPHRSLTTPPSHLPPTLCPNPHHPILTGNPDYSTLLHGCASYLSTLAKISRIPCHLYSQSICPTTRLPSSSAYPTTGLLKFLARSCHSLRVFARPW